MKTHNFRLKIDAKGNGYVFLDDREIMVSAINIDSQAGGATRVTCTFVGVEVDCDAISESFAEPGELRDVLNENEKRTDSDANA